MEAFSRLLFLKTRPSRAACTRVLSSAHVGCFTTQRERDRKSRAPPIGGKANYTMARGVFDTIKDSQHTPALCNGNYKPNSNQPDVLHKLQPSYS